MSDSIPGFTDEQAWALRTVARQAAEETVAQLASKPCGFACQEMDDVRATVYGNGTPGLKVRVTRLEEQTSDLIWFKRASLVAAFGAVGSLIVSLWK